MAVLTSISTASVVAAARLPVAAFAANPAFGVVGSVVKLDGRLSIDPDQQPLTYAWRFVSVPIGSQVVSEGFRTLDTDTTSLSPSQVSFSPDVVGEYVIGLIVTNSVFSSVEVTSVVSIRAILIPHGRGIIPDGKFIWTYIRDVWSQVEGKEFFETLWSALIQITGTELLKLYQVDFNKSIRDIQDKFQRRWLAYEPRLELSSADLSFYIGTHFAGTDASTINLALEGQAVILAPDEVIVILGARAQNVAGEVFTVVYSEDPANVGTYNLQSLNSGRNGYKLNLPELNPTQDTIGFDVEWDFSIGSVNWTLGGGRANPLALNLSERAPLMDTLLPLFTVPGGVANNIRTGDVIHFASGPNAGFYRILTKSGSFVTVDHAPPSFSNATTSLSLKTTVYRPVGFKLTQPVLAGTDTFTVPYLPGSDVSVIAPGRVVVLNGQAYTVVRSVVDINQILPSVVITVDSTNLPAGLRSLNWRTPHTLISQAVDFEALGVCTGDVLTFDISQDGIDLNSEISVQVVGVVGKALGFVLTDGAVGAGEIPNIPDAFFVQLATDFGVDGLIVSREGTISFSGTALEYLNSLSSGLFKRAYWNKELTSTSGVQVNPVFHLKPKYIIRNSKIPVDVDLRSIPLLQEWIVQPSLSEHDGKIFQVSNDKEFELRRKPIVLNENLDYVIDGEFAFTGTLIINTGSTDVEADNADFLDRSIGPGDIFTIKAPLTLAGDYVIEKVLSNSKIRLTRAIPAFVLGTLASAKVSLKRKKEGQFLRFVPGLFTSLNPAPARMWAEVSFFDNGQSIEDNFGILVGLTKNTLESVSKSINYRQAVAGLMFAFTRGSAIDKVRLGAQILLGLPFAEHKGIIRSIETNYRLDLQGNPSLGRLLIEDVDDSGAALGTLRIYTYPIDAPSKLAGIETNPVTGVEYQVGDTVELFAPLTKGVEIIDYLTNPLDANFSSIAQLQQFHSVRLRANDNIFSLDELDLVSGFLKKITPSYVAYSLITASEFADRVDIHDAVINLLKNDSNLIDNASLSLPATLMLNSVNANGTNQINFPNGLNLHGVSQIRRTGSDLVLTTATVGPGEARVTSAAGGFLNPKANEVFEPPLIRNDLELFDYLVIMEGPDKGVYAIFDVISNTELDVEAPEFGFQAATNVRFFVLRAAGQPYRFDANVTTSNPSIVLSSLIAAQLRTLGIAPGDWLILGNGSNSYRHLIKTVEESSPGVWNTVQVTPLPKFTNVSAEAIVVRPALRSPERLTDGFTLVGTGTNVVSISSGARITSLLNIGDEIVITSSGPYLDTRYTVLDPFVMYVTPPFPATTLAASILYKNKATGAVGWDHIEKYDPIEEAEVSLVETQALAACTATSKIVPLQAQRTTAPAGGAAAYNPLTGGVLPGDVLILTSGGNSTVDVGFGAGVYPIVKVTGTDVELSVALSNTGNASWKILRRR